MEVWIKKNDMKRFDPSRRVPRCSWLSRFFTKKKTNQNVNVSMCHLESDGDGFILVFFFFWGGKGRLGGERGFLYVFVETPMQQKISEQIGDDFFSTQHGSTLRTC